jgi:pantoate kinase
MRATAKTWGIVCALLGVCGCAETQTGAAAHATTAAIVGEDDADPRPVVRLRMEAGEDALQQTAFEVVRETLVGEGFVVSSGFTEGFDVDMVIQSRAPRVGALTRTSLTLAARVGTRAMAPISTELDMPNGDVDRAAIEELAERWQRRFHRNPRLDRHFLEVDRAADPR